MDDVRIETARVEHLPALQAIEREAGRRFAGLGLIDHLLDESLSLEELGEHQAAGRVWVALVEDRPVGFAVAGVVDGTAHLEELDVLRAHGGQGVGRRLVEHVCRWAEAHGYPALTLSTFRDIPWNAPLYARWGFRVLDPSEVGPELRQIRQRERGIGIPIEARVLMRRELGTYGIVLYDGECGFCSHVVQWLLRADRDGRLRFAPLQGETAAALRARHPEMPTDLDSMVYVEGRDDDEHVSWNSEAMLRLCRDVGGPWRLLWWLRVLPRRVTDLGYRLVARNRHRVSAGIGTCALPAPAERARFLP